LTAHWSNDDFEKSGVCIRSTAELLQSHLPFSNGSLEKLAAQPAKHKIYTHINNTNPVLLDSHRKMQEAAINALRFKCDVLWLILDGLTRTSKTS
jgi:pyrroloquinoline quinone biosynthesis protein B